MVLYIASFTEVLHQEVCLAGTVGPTHDLCDRVFETGAKSTVPIKPSYLSGRNEFT